MIKRVQTKTNRQMLFDKISFITLKNISLKKEKTDSIRDLDKADRDLSDSLQKYEQLQERFDDLELKKRKYLYFK